MEFGFDGQDTTPAVLGAATRTPRLADGPGEVHKPARRELSRYRSTP